VAVDSDPIAKLGFAPTCLPDHYSQARMFYRSQTPIEQAHIASALVFELSKVELEHVRILVLANLRNGDQELASRVAHGLAMPLPPASTPAMKPIEMRRSPALSIVGKFKPTLVGRKVGILFDEGSSKKDVERVKSAVEAAGGKAMLIAPKVGGIDVGRNARQTDSLRARRPCCSTPSPSSSRKGSRQACGRGRGGGFCPRCVRAPQGDWLHGRLQTIAGKGGCCCRPWRDGLDNKFVQAAATRFFDRGRSFEPGMS
jgi:catalase